MGAICCLRLVSIVYIPLLSPITFLTTPHDTTMQPPQLTLRGLSGAVAPHMSLATNQPPRSPKEPATSYSPSSTGAFLLKRPLASISAGTVNGFGSGAEESTHSSTSSDGSPSQEREEAWDSGLSSEDRATKDSDECNAVCEEELSSSASMAVPTLTHASTTSASISLSSLAHTPTNSASSVSFPTRVHPEESSACAAAEQKFQIATATSPNSLQVAVCNPPPKLWLPLDGRGSGGRGQAYPEDSLSSKKEALVAMFERLVPDKEGTWRGLAVEDFGEFTKSYCRLPGFLQEPLFRRVLAFEEHRPAPPPAGSRSSSAWNQVGTKIIHGVEDVSSCGDPDASPQSIQMAGAVGSEGRSPSPTASPSGSSSNLSTAGASGRETLSLDTLLRFWAIEMAPFDTTDRLFRLLKQPDATYIVKDDLFPFLHRLLETHPGLEFLRSHPDFQQKYALTVASRIFYTLNRAGTGKISAKELRRSGLLRAMQFVDENEDINKETSFFSYEHFYVLYCRFWELDTDRDGALTREDLLKYGDHSLSNAIVDRIFEVGARPFEDGLGGKRSSKEREKMMYEDFIFFMLSEEDKGNEASLRYWFHCVDVDGDGRLSLQDMRYFYNIQLQRMEWLGHELVPFEDVLCQMLDMLKPTRDLSRCRQQRVFPVAVSAGEGRGSKSQLQDKDDVRAVEKTRGKSSAPLVVNAAAAFAQEEEVRAGGLHIEDFLLPDKIKIAGVFFDALFNLNKFLAFEQRDPFGDRQKREDPFDSDWERFAYRDYQQLAMDEEDNEGGSYAEETEGQQITNMDVEDEGDEEDDDDDEDGEEEIDEKRALQAVPGSSMLGETSEGMEDAEGAGSERSVADGSNVGEVEGASGKLSRESKQMLNGVPLH